MKYEELKNFILNEMRMQEKRNYQPIMIRYLNQNKGKATKKEIQEALHQANPDFPAKYFSDSPVFDVLTTSHPVADYDSKDDTYRLFDYETYTAAQKAHITMYCDDKIRESANPVNPRIILFSVSGEKPFEHFKDTITKDVISNTLPVDTILKNFQTIRVWGSVNNPQKYNKWKELKKGDIFLFYHNKKYIASAFLEGTEQNPELADHLWSYKDPETKQSFELIMYIKPTDVFNEDVDYQNFNKLLDYEIETFMPTRTLDFTTVKKNKTDELIKKHGNLENALKTIGFRLGGNDSTNNLEELIQKFDINKNIFLENYSERKTETFKTRDQFLARFPIEKILAMNLDDYVVGKRDETSFSHMLENSLPAFGKISGRYASIHGIYWAKEFEKYKWNGKFLDENEAFASIKQQIHSMLLAAKKLENDGDWLGFSNFMETQNKTIFANVKSKILSVYFPNLFLDLHKKILLNYTLDAFKVKNETSEDRYILQKQILDLKNNHKIMKNWDNMDFSHFVFNIISNNDENEEELEDMENNDTLGNYYIITQNEDSKYDDIPGKQYAYDSDKANYKNFLDGTNFIVQSKIDNQNYFVGYGKVGNIKTESPRVKENGRRVTDIIAKFSEYHEFPQKKLRTDQINEKMLNLAFPSGGRNIPPAMLPITKELYDEIIGDELESSVESEKPYSFEEFENFLNQILELDMYDPDTTSKHPKLNVKTLQIFFKITYYCALKVTEVIELRKNDFDIENRILTVNDSKAGKPGNQMTTIPLPIIGELIPFLNSIKGNEKLFDISRQSIWKLTSKIAERIDKNGDRRITPEIFRKSYAELMATNHADHNLITLKLRNAFPSSTYGTLPTLNDLKKWEERIFEKSIKNNQNPKSFENAKLVFPPNLNEAKNEIQKQLLIPSDVIERIIFSLYSGKHVILTGPVGTGKTHLAKLIPKIAWSKIGGYYSETVTATSEWTTQDVVGGIFPKIDGDQIKYNIQKGCVADTISKNWLDKTGKSNERIKFKKEGVEYNGVWLVIDEFNRANIDRAFGPLFTALEYKKLQIPTTKPDESYEELTIPEDYRIIGTLNTFDKHFLFRLSDALKRRFSFIEILPPTYDKIIEEVRFVSDKALENYDDIKQELKIQNFDDLRKNPEVYSLLTNLYEILAFVRLSKNLGTAVLISMFRFALINYQQTKNLDNSLDAAVLTHLLPHLESLQYWQIDSIMNFVGGRIHEMFRKFDVNKRPDVDRYEEELRNLTKYLRVSGTNKSAGNWIAKFRTGEIFKLSTPITDLDPWNNKKRPVLQRFREALESLKKEKGYFEEAEGLNE